MRILAKGIEIVTLIYYWPVLSLFTIGYLSLSIGQQFEVENTWPKAIHINQRCRKANHFQITFEWLFPQIEPHSNTNKIYVLFDSTISRLDAQYCSLFTKLRDNFEQYFMHPNRCTPKKTWLFINFDDHSNKNA